MIKNTGLDTKFVLVCNLGLQGSKCGTFNLKPAI